MKCTIYDDEVDSLLDLTRDFMDNLLKYLTYVPEDKLFNRKVNSLVQTLIWFKNDMKANHITRRVDL
jgi:hypothetical protein